MVVRVINIEFVKKAFGSDLLDPAMFFPWSNSIDVKGLDIMDFWWLQLLLA